MLNRYQFQHPLTLFLLSLVIIACLPSLLSHRQTKNNPVVQPLQIPPSQDNKVIYRQFNQYPKILVFQGEIKQKGKGQLLLIDTKTVKVDASFLARSGIGGVETAPAYGPLPSNWRLKFKHYTVTTKPLVLNIPGIMGNFYQINPYNFQFAGVTRGDFGIHADRGNNGTLGCIGVNQKDWIELQAMMKHLADSGLAKVPLLVANY